MAGSNALSSERLAERAVTANELLRYKVTMRPKVSISKHKGLSVCPLLFCAFLTY